MENQQQQNATNLCRAGCGFFGAAATEGYCSKCFKDQIQRKQERISPTLVPSVPLMASSSSNTNSVSPPPVVLTTVSSSPSSTSVMDTHSPTTAGSSSEKVQQTCSQAALSTECLAAKLESAEAVAAAEGMPNLSSSSSACNLDVSLGEPAVAAAAAALDLTSVGPPVRKVNRCGCCNKKVGLTGFPCRCGGLYCSEHRYDTAHNCQFDYKTMEREQIAKNNPVVVSDKIQRI